MCGILGSFLASPGAPTPPRFSHAVSMLSHRGPDVASEKVIRSPASTLFLGHTRLSILGSGQDGAQPLTSRDGRWEMVFNGEILNYVEVRKELEQDGFQVAGNSDSAVLIEAWARWGTACLQKIDGMFAFVVFDRALHDLYCVRDRWGIKPLYVERKDSSFLFSSEVPALLEIKESAPQANISSVYQFLIHGQYDKAGDTFLKDIEAVKPAHFIKVSINTDSGTFSSRTERYWSAPKVQSFTGNFDDAVEQVRTLFLASVQRNLRSDVPVSVALSGGIDSSSIASAVRYLEPKSEIQAFSFVAPGTDVDEQKWAELVAKEKGIQLNLVEANSTGLSNDLDDLIKTQGEPFGSTSVYAQYSVYRRAAMRGFRVMLDGQGADELFAGYRGYPEFRLRSLIEKGNVPSAVKFALAMRQSTGPRYKEHLKSFIATFAPPSLHEWGYSTLGKSLRPDWINTDWLDDSELKFSHPVSDLYPLSAQGNGRRLMQRLDFALHGDQFAQLLRHGDRNSMRWSVESRVPFLDKTLVEAVLSFPEEFMLGSDGTTKNLLRHALDGITPSSVLLRKDKIGFSTPEQEWLGKELGSLDDWLEGLRDVPFVRLDKARKEIADMVEGRKAFSWLGWRLINLSKWTRLFGVTY